MAFSNEKFISIMNTTPRCLKVIPTDDMYMMEGCNLVFSHHGKYAAAEEVRVQGIIPMDLAEIIYACSKTMKEEEKKYIEINDLKEGFHHKDLDDFDKISFDAAMKDKPYVEYLKELRERLFNEDYENCYFRKIAINNPLSLEWLIITVRNYYEEKLNQTVYASVRQRTITPDSDTHL